MCRLHLLYWCCTTATNSPLSGGSMNVLIVYYSNEGTTATVAEDMAGSTP
jgi:hypothetical protein